MIKLIAFDLVGVLVNKKRVDNKTSNIEDRDIFKKVKAINNNLKIIIATNNYSSIRRFINESFDTRYLDDMVISGEINRFKPNIDFYKYILNKYKLKPEELLFLDDSINNIISAKSLGINTIKVNENTDLIREIKNFII